MVFYLLKLLLILFYAFYPQKYAKDFDLDVEPVHEARVKKILLDMSCLQHNRALIEVKFGILMNLLLKIQNKDFLVEIRLTEIPDRSLMTKFLEYLLNNINTNVS